MTDQNDQYGNHPSSMMGLRPISDVLNSLPISASSTEISTEPSRNLSTIGNPVDAQCPTGKRPSETVLGSLRNIAQNVLNGKMMDDETFRTLLVQHFGSSRLTSITKLKHCYTDGYECKVDGYEISLDALHDSEMDLFSAVEFLNRPAKKDFIAKELARVRVVMARRAESNDDLALLIDTYANHLAEFPPDVVKAACEKIIDNAKWFPLVSEMRAEMARLVRYRRAVMQCFEEIRNPLLAGRATQRRLASDPRCHQHWRDLPKKDWLHCHFDWAIGEAEKMLETARANPQFFSADDWEKRIAGLKRDKEKQRD